MPDRSREHVFGYSAMRDALAALSEYCPPQSEIILVGGAAALFCRWLVRTTTDIDVIEAEPRLVHIQSAIERIADEFGLPERWINDGAKAFVEILPADFRTRVVEVMQLGALRVCAISRQDFILLKLYAFRDIDFEDLRVLRPTADELAFVRQQLPRIAQFDAKKAHYIELYLRQGIDT